MPMPNQGAVLGVDVGWSARKRSTGICLLYWSRTEVRAQMAEVGIEANKRVAALEAIVAGRRLEAVAIDGPLTPGFVTIDEYRIAEALLSRAKFQKRGKPGPANGGSGPRLHSEATLWAQTLSASATIVQATEPWAPGRPAIYEAFPNLFLGVLHPEPYPISPGNRRWTDLLFGKHNVQTSLRGVVTELLPDRSNEIDLTAITNHERIASLSCAITALCVVTGRYIAVGDSRGGHIVLPPVEFWGGSGKSRNPWAEVALAESLASVKRNRRWVGTTPTMWRDQQPWTPRNSA